MPKHENIQEYRIIGFDTEDDTRGTPLSFAFHDGENYYYTVSPAKALQYVLNYPRPAIFCAHNLEYDIVNLFKHCDYKFIDKMIYASKLLRVSLIGKKHFFINSHSFFSGSVEKMGKILNVPKLKASMLDSKYNIQDALIVQKFMSNFQTRVNDYGVNLGVSVGQMAMAIFRHSYLPSHGYKSCNEKICLDAYYGGRVEVFYRGQVKDISVCDINSCYPYVMSNMEYPNTTFMENSQLSTHRFGVGKFSIYVPDSTFIPPLPFKSESGRLFFPTGEITGTWTYAEVRFALSLPGVKILKEFDGGIGTNEACAPFKDFIHFFYETRLKHKEILKREKDNSNSLFESELLKLIMNNLYGKFNQHKDSSELTRVKLSAFELRKREGAIERKIGPFYSYRFPRNEAPSTANYLWGTHVTSYARIFLAQNLIKVHQSGCKILYCDTDSIMFTGKNPLPVSSNMGDWDISTYPVGVFKQSKGYILFEHKASTLDREPVYYPSKVACKGVPTSHALDFVIKGMSEFVSPVRLKAGLIRQNADVNKGQADDVIRALGANVWNGVTKEMRSIYIKRKGLHDTMPVNVKDIPEMEKEAFRREDENEELSFLYSDYERSNYWRNFTVPEGFNLKPDEGKGWLDYPDESNAPFFLTQNQTIGLEVGEKWFAGEIIDVFYSKSGKQFYLLNLENFIATDIIGFKLYGYISTDFFFETPKKHLTFFLNELYFGTGILKVKILDKGNTTPFSLDKKTGVKG